MHLRLHRRPVLLFAIFASLLFSAVAGASGHVWVTDELGDTVTVIDVETNEVLATLWTEGHMPHNVRFSPDGRLAYVFSVGSSTIEAFDTQTFELVHVIQDQVGKSNHDGAWTVDGAELWSANTAGNDIAIIDAVTNEIVARIQAPGRTPALVNFSPDGARAYVPQINSGDVAVFDVATREHLATVPAGHGAMGTVLFVEREELWVTGGNDNLIAIIDTARDELKELIHLRSHPHDLRATPDGKQVVVSLRDSNAVVVFDVASRTVVGAVGTELRPDMVAITADGRYAYVTNRASDSVTKIDLVNLQQVTTIPVGAGPHGIAVR